MGVQTLLKFAEKGSIEGAVERVELTQIARNLSARTKLGKPVVPGARLCLVLDAQCCLDRLYGGFFSDWTCGGQWNRMLQFLNQLFSACQKGNIELTIAFNGALEQQRLSEWAQQQHAYRQNVQLVLRHILNKGTPPPKVWWVPPTCLTTALRLALRHLNIPMICSMDDHHQEVLAYCRENNLHGIIGDDAEYLVFAPPRCFSACSLKLTFKGSIESKEVFPNKIAEGLGLDTRGVCILAALLGNYLLTESQLTAIYARLQINTVKEATDAVPILAEYVKKLKNCDNLDNLSVEIFGDDKAEKAVKRRQSFIESVQYYLDGTKDGFLKYKPRKAKKKVLNVKKDGVRASTSTDPSGDLDNSGFASETPEIEAGSREAYSLLAEQQQIKKFLMSDVESVKSPSPVVNGTASPKGETKGRHGTAASSVTCSNGEDPVSKPPVHCDKKKRLLFAPDVVRTTGERHQRGYMSPLINQIITYGEIKLPVVLEDDLTREIPSVHQIYRPIRQSIYAILFNLHHQLYVAREQGEKASVERPSVKEWTYPYVAPEIVVAEPISWSVPTVQRLWFGTNVEDMRRRLRAYLSCMKSDSPLMISTAYVPQHLLLMASVLRYLMQLSVPILRQMELDAFIVTALCPDLMDSEYTQELQLPVVTLRGVQLANLFMQGVEMAVLANEACGAPISYLMCSPWLFFDGKLFHNILAKTEFVKSLQELCNHRLDVLVKVERMRHAIMENLQVQYARRGLSNIGCAVLPYSSPGIVPAGYNPPPPPPPTERQQPLLRGNQRRAVSARGGQLEVAGVVVCSWGPNYSLARDRNQPPPMPGRGFNRNYSDRATFPAHGRGGFVSRRKPNSGKRQKTKKNNRERSREANNSSTIQEPLQSGSSDEAGNSSDDAQKAPKNVESPGESSV